MSHYDCKHCHASPTEPHASDCLRCWRAKVVTNPVEVTPEEGWLIHKAGRGWYRPNAEGYTSSPTEAGRYTHADALSYSHPNGLDGPRDGMTIKHKSEFPSLASQYGLVQALEAVKAAMVRGADGHILKTGWSISKLNDARPLIHAALKGLTGGAE